MLAETVKRGGDRKSRSPDGTLIRLRDLGVSKKESSRWQRAAAVPAEDFERCIGLAVRKGQAEGRIAKRGDPRKAHDLKRPVDYASENELSDNGAGIYAMTDNVTDEEFETAVEAARAAGLGPYCRPASGRPGASCAAA
ncbi:MAG: hypothetical protein M5U32_11065 [Myxococcota bacterium]|nr:hypothetical protein [Myxococcota bacterium]